MNGIQHLDPFVRFVTAIEPWLDQVVIVGGSAHRLYRMHPYAQELDYPPLTTLDTDVAVPARIPDGGQDIRQRLLASGFMEEFLGHDHPPATHYRLGGDASGFYAEFVTPLIGSEYDRKHKRKATVQIAGVNSQQLRHIELLLHHPWSIDLQSEGFAAKIRLANPVSFLAQKVLIHEKRQREDRAKNILYMHDTLEVFGDDSRSCGTCGGISSLLSCGPVAPPPYRRRQKFFLVNSVTTFGGRRRSPLDGDYPPKPFGEPAVTVSLGFTQVFG